MKWIIILLAVVVALVAAGLIWTALKRKQDTGRREQADELRSEAASVTTTQREQEARVREAEAEAERVRAQADKLEVRAQEERTSYDMTRAKQEDSLRTADRLDPDVDHRSPDYQPDLDGSPTHRRDEATDTRDHL